MMTATATCEAHGQPTQIRCAKCQRPICPRCLVRTELGLRCASCAEPDAAAQRLPTARRPRALVIAGVATALTAAVIAAVVIAGAGGAGRVVAGPRPVGTWSILPPLPAIRGTPVAITLRGGDVLVAGGGVGALASAASELYDTATGRWSATGPLQHARRGARAVLLTDGRVLIAGGIAGGRILAAAELYDPATRRWSRTGSMHLARLDFTLTLLRSGEVLATGGASPTGIAGTAGGQAVHLTSSAEVYDPATGAWTPTGSMAVGRFEATGTLLPNGGVLVVGGFGGPTVGGAFQALASSEIYEPASRAFTRASNMPQGTADQNAVALADGDVLVTGGLGGDGSSALSSVDRYSPSSGTWSGAPAMRQQRDAAAAAALPDGDVLVAGGQAVAGGTAEPLASAELYDPSSNRWLPAGAMGCPRSEPAIAVLPGGDALVLAGDATFPGTAPVARGCVDRYAPPTARPGVGNE